MRSAVTRRSLGGALSAAIAWTAAFGLAQPSCADHEPVAPASIGLDAGADGSSGPSSARADASAASGKGPNANGSAPGTEGAAGSSAQSGDMGEQAPDHPTFVSAERQGALVEISFANTSAAFVLLCTTGTELLKSSGQAWTDATPACGTGAYYLDGEYRDNPPGAAGCCDGPSSCVPFAAAQTFVAADRVRTGAREEDDAGVETASDAGVDAGSNVALPVLDTRPDPGPYQLVIRYYEDAECSVGLYELEPISVDVPPAGG